MEKTKILTWEQAVKEVSLGNVSLSQKDIASLVTYARKAGIGKIVTFQKTEYTHDDLNKLKVFLDWWNLLNNETANEWRDKETSILIQKIVANSLVSDLKVSIYAVFCPSYNKGIGAFGYTGVTGKHTKSTITKMSEFVKLSSKIGLKIEATAYLSDLILENYEKLQGTDYKQDLLKNFTDFKNQFSLKNKAVTVKFLSDIPELSHKLAEKGFVTKKESVSPKIFSRVYERNLIFYKEVLGWNEAQVEKRTKVLASSYAYMGEVFNKLYPKGIMYWTESAYERSSMYSGMHPQKTIPIIFPNK